MLKNTPMYADVKRKLDKIQNLIDLTMNDNDDVQSTSRSEYESMRTKKIAELEQRVEENEKNAKSHKTQRRKDKTK